MRLGIIVALQIIGAPPISLDSPLYDAVPCVAGVDTDSRGVPRPQIVRTVPEPLPGESTSGWCDLGAYEYRWPEDFIEGQTIAPPTGLTVTIK